MKTKRIFDKPVYVRKLLERADGHLVNVDAARKTQSNIFKYVENRTKLPRIKIKRYNDILAYRDHHDPVDIIEPLGLDFGKCELFTDPLTELCWNIKTTVQLLREFDDVERLVPYLDRLRDYGINLDVDDKAADPDLLAHPKVDKKCSVDVYEKMEHAANYQHTICAETDNVKDLKIVASDYNYVGGKDWRETAQLYHRQKHKPGKRLDQKLFDVADQHEKAAVATDEIDKGIR